jgi:hypothetical protein
MCGARGTSSRPTTPHPGARSQRRSGDGARSRGPDDVARLARRQPTHGLGLLVFALLRPKPGRPCCVRIPHLGALRPGRSFSLPLPLDKRASPPPRGTRPPPTNGALQPHGGWLLVLDHRRSVGLLVCGASGFCVERKGALCPGRNSRERQCAPAPTPALHRRCASRRSEGRSLSARQVRVTIMGPSAREPTQQYCAAQLART